MSLLFNRVALIGIGLIGSSLARAIRDNKLANKIAVASRSASTLEKARKLDLGDIYTSDCALAVEKCDLVVICTPLGAYKSIAKSIAGTLKNGAIVTDVGSTKMCVKKYIKPYLPKTVHLVPGHPVAGTEKSGPENGFSELFQQRWCILTPDKSTNELAVERVANLWRCIGMTVEFMSASHHDQILSITSHLPHLIAFTVVGTASGLEEKLRREVIKFSASGFRDFTRIAASDPTMWRDIFLENRIAVLEMLDRFSNNLDSIREAIRKNDGDALYEMFEKTQNKRKQIIEARQHIPEEQKVIRHK